ARPRARDAGDRRRQGDLRDGARLVRSVAALLLTLLAVSGASAQSSPPVTVFAASSLTDAFPRIERSATYSFAGSNTLAAQIRQGAPESGRRPRRLRPSEARREARDRGAGRPGRRLHAASAAPAEADAPCRQPRDGRPGGARQSRAGRGGRRPRLLDRRANGSAQG